MISPFLARKGDASGVRKVIPVALWRTFAASAPKKACKTAGSRFGRIGKKYDILAVEKAEKAPWGNSDKEDSDIQMATFREIATIFSFMVSQQLVSA